MLGNLSDLDLRLIRVFLAVVDAGGITPAQATLNVGQSTISTQLSSLETRLGFRLCERGRGGFALTAKGERLVELSRALLTAVGDFTEQARHMDKQLVGDLRIGLIGHTPLSQNARISEAIARFRGRNEAVRFDIQVRPPGELEEDLINGSVEIAVGYFWHRVPTLNYTSLFIEKQIAYCGRSHPLFDNAGNTGFDEVAPHEWAWRSYPIPEAQIYANEINITAQADNMEAVAMLILSGYHLGFLPIHFAEPYVKQGLLKPLNPKLFHYEVPFFVVTRQKRYLSEIVSAFLEDLQAAHAGDG